MTSKHVAYYLWMLDITGSINCYVISIDSISGQWRIFYRHINGFLCYSYHLKSVWWLFMHTQTMLKTIDHHTWYITINGFKRQLMFIDITSLFYLPSLHVTPLYPGRQPRQVPLTMWQWPSWQLCGQGIEQFAP